MLQPNGSATRSGEKNWTFLQRNPTHATRGASFPPQLMNSDFLMYLHFRILVPFPGMFPNLQRGVIILEFRNMGGSLRAPQKQTQHWHQHVPWVVVCYVVDPISKNTWNSLPTSNTVAAVTKVWIFDPIESILGSGCFTFLLIYSRTFFLGELFVSPHPSHVWPQKMTNLKFNALLSWVPISPCFKMRW